MSPRGFRCLVTLLIAATLMAGCHMDPNARKQRYLASGNRYSAQGKYREAVIQYANALKIDKAYPDAHYALALAYEHLGQYTPAYSELMRTVELQPTNYSARIDLGKLLLASGKPDDAQAQADAVMAAQPKNPELYALLSEIALKRGLRDQALAFMQHAVALDPNRAGFHEQIAMLQAGDPAKASSVEAELKKAVALDPKSANAKLLLAAFYVQNNRWAEAEQVSRDAVATDPKSIMVRQSLAEVFLKQGNEAKAEEVLRQASHDLADNPQGVQILADYYVRTGQIEKAKAELASLYTQYPKYAAVQKSYVRVLLRLNDYATAQPVIAKLMKAGGKDPEIAVLNGMVLLNAGQTDQAVNVLRQAAIDSPDDALTQYWLGKAALAKGDSALAVSSFRRTVELDPRGLEAPEELAQIAMQRGDANMLAEVANKTIAAAPRFPGGYVWRAMVEISQKQPDKGEADLKTAMYMAPQSPMAYLELARLRFAQKRIPDGVALLQQVLQYDPGSTEAVRMLVSYHMSQKQPDKALALLNEQIAKSPNNSSLYDLLAELQAETKNLDQASATAQKAMQMNPADGEAVMLYAQFQSRRGELDNAIVAWQQWSKAHPNDANVLALLGTLEESRGDTKTADADYRKALQLQPQQPIAANNLAFRLLEEGGNLDEAMTLAQTARRVLPNSPDIADTLAWVYYYKGIYNYARDILEDAAKTDPNSAAIQYHLGMVYSKLKEKDSASLHLKKAIALAPDSPTAKDARVALQGLG